MTTQISDKLRKDLRDEKVAVAKAYVFATVVVVGGILLVLKLIF